MIPVRRERKSGCNWQHLRPWQKNISYIIHIRSHTRIASIYIYMYIYISLYIYGWTAFNIFDTSQRFKPLEDPSRARHITWDEALGIVSTSWTAAESSPGEDGMMLLIDEAWKVWGVYSIYIIYIYIYIYNVWKHMKTLESACQTCHDVHNVVFASSFCQIIQLLRLELMTHKMPKSHKSSVFL